jgi:hypothetical protein
MRTLILAVCVALLFSAPLWACPQTVALAAAPACYAQQQSLSFLAIPQQQVFMAGYSSLGGVAPTTTVFERGGLFGGRSSFFQTGPGGTTSFERRGLFGRRSSLIQTR